MNIDALRPQTFVKIASAVALIATMLPATIANAQTGPGGRDCFPNGAGGYTCTQYLTPQELWGDWYFIHAFPGWAFTFEAPRFQVELTGTPPDGFDHQVQSLETLPARFDTGSMQCLNFPQPVKLFDIQILYGADNGNGYFEYLYEYSDAAPTTWGHDSRNVQIGMVTKACYRYRGVTGWSHVTVTGFRLSKIWEYYPTPEAWATLNAQTATPTITQTPTNTATPTITPTPTTTGTPTPIAGPTHISDPGGTGTNTGWECTPGQEYPKCSDWLDLPLVNTVWSRANLPADVPAWDGVRMWVDQPVQDYIKQGNPPVDFEWRADSLMDGNGRYDTSALQCLYFPEPAPLWGIKIDYTEAPSGRGEFRYWVWDTSDVSESGWYHVPDIKADSGHLVRSICMEYFQMGGAGWSHVQVSRVQVRRWLYASEYTNLAIGTPTALPAYTAPTATPQWIVYTPSPRVTDPAAMSCWPWVRLLNGEWHCMYHAMGLDAPLQMLNSEGGMIDIYGDAMMVLPNAIQFQTITLDGQAQVSQGITTPWLATDPTGLGAGWHLNIAATDFSDGHGHAIAVNGFRASLPESAITRLYGSTAPTTTMNLPTALSTTPQMLLHAVADTGMGQYTLQPAFTLDVPSDTYVGTYTSVVTVQIISGP